MRRLPLLRFLLPLGLLVGTPSRAADWLSIQGLEPDDPEAARLRPFGFVQVSAEAIASRPVEGLTGELEAFNGQRAAFNHVVGTDTPARFTLRRVRVGSRGVIPRTDGRLNAMVALEVGQNPLTTAADGWRPTLMDASITLRGPGVHLRVGQMKVPLADETLEAFHVTTDLVRFSPVVGRLLMERDATSGVLTGRINGFRDVGAQLFGSHVVRDTELSWAAMAGNGTTDLRRVEPGIDLTGRVQVAHLYEDGAPRRSPLRDELAGFAFGSTGVRNVGDEQARRVRVGAGAQLRREGVRVRLEGVYADGAVTTGRAPPFAGGSLTVDASGRAWGATALASARFDDTWEVGLAGSHLDSLPGEGPRRRLLQDVTLFGQYHLSRHAWFDLNLAWRHGRAPQGSDNARRILDTLGPYGAVMVTVIP